VHRHLLAVELPRPDWSPVSSLAFLAGRITDQGRNGTFDNSLAFGCKDDNQIKKAEPCHGPFRIVIIECPNRGQWLMKDLTKCPGCSSFVC
jgi:hypothetical protein